MSNWKKYPREEDPHLTGEYPFDPHEPFWVGDDAEEDGRWAVYWGNDEDHFWDGLTKPQAEKLARILNNRYSLREAQPDPRGGQCLVCGDWH